MKWYQTKIYKLVEMHSKQFNLDEHMVAAILHAESAGDPFAIRYEPMFHFSYKVEWFAGKNNITKDTEKILQKSSIGLMQCMGVVVRELGFNGNLLELTDPEKSIFFGCMKLEKLSKKYMKEDDVISAYNAGSVKKSGVYKNAAYVDKVNRFIHKFDSGRWRVHS